MCNKDSVAFVISILLEDFITRWMKITICDIFHLYISMLLMVRSYLYTVVTDLIYQRGMWCLFISVYRRYRSHLSEGSVMFVYICIPSLQISFIRGECDVCLYLYTVVTDLIYQRGVWCLFISVYRRYRSHLSEGSVMFVYICIPSLQISFIRGECDVCLYLYTVVTDLIYQRGVWCLFISVYRRYRSHLSEGSVMFVYICIPSLQISFIRGECDVCLYLYTVVTDLIYQRGVGLSYFNGNIKHFFEYSWFHFCFKSTLAMSMRIQHHNNFF